MAANVKNALLSWRCKAIGRRKKDLRAAPYCLFWVVWKQRNKVAFKDKTLDVQKWKVIFVSSLWSWIWAVDKLPGHPYSIYQLAGNLGERNFSVLFSMIFCKGKTLGEFSLNILYSVLINQKKKNGIIDIGIIQST